MNKIAETKLLESMDIFSLGCVLAELFSDASPLFTLKTLLNYKRGLFDPYSKLSCIASSPIKVAQNNLTLLFLGYDSEND